MHVMNTDEPVPILKEITTEIKHLDANLKAYSV